MLTVKEIKLEGDFSWDGLIKESSTASFFQTKEWLKVWVKHFRGLPKILAVYEGDKLIGIVPLDISGGKVNFLGLNGVLGGQQVSDFGDIIAVSGREKEIWEKVLKEFKTEKLEFDFIRENSPSFKILQGSSTKVQEIDAAPYIELPDTWDEYLSALGRHDRHELRRKIRRGEEEGVTLSEFSGKSQECELFLQLMAQSSEQKKDFLSVQMESFFTDVINTFWEKKMLSLTFLKLAEKTIAAAMTFLFKNEILLYNSGLNKEFMHLSPGLILTANLIQNAIEKGRKRFDFLRGKERYKYDLGGKERKLYKITY